MPFLASLKNARYTEPLGPHSWHFVCNSEAKQGADTASAELPAWTFVSQLQYKVSCMAAVKWRFLGRCRDIEQRFYLMCKGTCLNLGSVLAISQFYVESIGQEGIGDLCVRPGKEPRAAAWIKSGSGNFVLRNVGYLTADGGYVFLKVSQYPGLLFCKFAIKIQILNCIEESEDSSFNSRSYIFSHCL